MDLSVGLGHKRGESKNTDSSLYFQAFVLALGFPVRPSMLTQAAYHVYEHVTCKENEQCDLTHLAQDELNVRGAPAQKRSSCQKAASKRQT